MDFSQNFFELFQLPPHFEVDEAELTERFQRLQRRIHPDRFVGQGAQAERLATQWATHINEAFATLSDRLRRAIYLLSMQAIDLEENPSLSGEFLMEQITLRESLDAAEKSGDPQVMEDFIAEIEGDSEQVAKAFGELFESKAYDEALQRVYQLQFLKKLMQSARAAEDRLLGY